MKFLITYDLKEGQDYDELYTAIKALGAYWHGMQNVWFVKTNLSVTAVRDALQNHVRSNDKIFVCRLDHWASYNLDGEGSNWLNS